MTAMRPLILSFLCLLQTFLFGDASSYFLRQLEKAKPGDYIVTHESGSYGVLCVLSKEKEILTLEEIDVPDFAIKESTINWKTWVKNKAPSHSSWMYIRLNLQKGELLHIYSVTKKSFLRLSEEETPFFRILSLPMNTLHANERRKIGPPPMPGEEDHRPIWNPPLYFEGEKRKAKTSVKRALWPKDNSLLSGCKIDLFFEDLLPDFPFPIWIEIYSGHFKGRIRVIEAGRNMQSLPPQFPKKFTETGS